MKILKSLLMIASALAAATSSFAASPALKTVVNVAQKGDDKALWAWSSVCVNNVDVGAAVNAQYRWGSDGDFAALTLDPNTTWIFAERFPNSGEPDVFTIKFMNRDGDGATELTYDLNKTETRFRQRNCDQLETYSFEKSDGIDRSVDLIHVDQP